MTDKKTLSPPIYLYVLGVLKGSVSLGNIAAEARVFELGINEFLDKLDLKEAGEDGF